MYKALEHQYQRGLQTLESQMSEIDAEVVLKGVNVMFRPALEELKEKYYAEIKAFVGWPASKNFAGVGGGRPELFAGMPAKNSAFL